jgi:ATP-binding cassette subfamily B protein
MSTEKRLARYALTSKGPIIGALIMLMIAVGAELTGPFIAKHVIDTHISGIEDPWYPSAENHYAVNYNGEQYTRDLYLPAHERQGDAVQILQIGMRFYFTESPLPTNGARSYNDGILRVETSNEVFESEAELLSAADVMAFYTPEIRAILNWLLLYIGIIVFASFFQYGQSFYLKKAAQHILQQMRMDVFRQLSRVPVSFFDHQPAGKIVARITNDTEAVRELYMAVLANFFSSTIYIIGIYVALFLLDVRLAVMTLVLLPILVLWIKLYRRFSSGYNQAIREKNAEINSVMNESIQGMSMIQAFRQEKASEEKFTALNDEHYRFQTKLLRLNSMTGHNLTFAVKNLFFIALIWMISGGTAGLFTLGVLYAFVDYMNRMFEPIDQITSQLANLEQARAAGHRVFELMDETGMDVDDTTMPRPAGTVAFNDVTFGYNDEDPVLKGLSFQAKAGETVALVGHTGSGKSSIMNLLFRFYDPQYGSITVDGCDTQQLSPQALRAHMGIVLQEPYLFSGTIAENIAYGQPNATRVEIEAAIDAVGGTAIFAKLKNGIDEAVTERGSTLSSGQRQLISFARALVANPAILVLDEATSNIDTETEILIQKGMQLLQKDRTTFVIAHRLSTIKDADQIIVLDNGEILEKGTHAELLFAGGTYARMYAMQQGQAG